MFLELDDGRVKRVLLLTSALSFLLLTTAIVSLHDAPVTGYEYSVFDSTPLVFWVAVIAGLLNGILLFVKNYGRSRAMWGLGLFQILLSNFILISLYLYRGFIYIERDDSQSYIGYAKEIVLLGHFPSSNFYPMGSILMSSTGDVLGQSVVLVSQLFPAVFFTVYTLGILCWSKTLSTRPRFVTSMMLASMPIFFAWFIPSIFHETWCVLMLPFFYFILWKKVNGDRRLKLLSAIMIVFFTIGHPMIAVSVLLVLAIVMATERITRREARMVSTALFLFASLVLILWIFNNAMLVQSTQIIVEQLLGIAEGVSTFGSAQGQASQFGILSALRSILLCTIDDIIYIILALWLMLIILRNKWRTHPMTVLMACFLGGSAFLAVMILFTFAHNPFRMVNLNFVMIFAVPLVGYLLCSLRDGGKIMRARLVTLLILFCVVSTVLTVYQGPAEGFPNGAITRSEAVGSNWFLTDRAESVQIYNLQTNPWRYADLIRGDQYVLDNPDIKYDLGTTTAHFDSYLSSNETGVTQYLVITTYDEMAYTITWASVDKFNIGDFDHVVLSTAVNRVYANHCFKVYSRA